MEKLECTKKNNSFTHRVSWTTEFSELSRCICTVNLKGHAGSRTQLGHHTLQHEQSRVNKMLLALPSTFTSERVYYVPDLGYWIAPERL